LFSLRIDAEIELRLHDLTQADTQFAVIDANRRHIGEHLGWVHHHLSAEDTRQFIQNARRSFANGTDLSVAIYYHGQFVGSAGLHVRDTLARKGEIGYWLAKAVNGKGIMTRVVRVLLDYGFQIFGLHKIIIRAATNNPASAGIPKRLGFQLEGTLRADGYVYDHYVDLEVYALFAHDWHITQANPDFGYPVDEALVLRPFQMHHAHALFMLVDQNRDFLRRWLPWVEVTLDVSDEEAFIRLNLDQYARSDGVAMGLWYHGKLVGSVGFHFWNYGNRSTEIGYWLAEAHNGKGLMTRAVQAMTTYAIRELALNRVIIRCATENHASCALPQRLGFHHEGVQRAEQWLYDRYVDLNVYSMLARDWGK
jgi:ribosomal-protein-serine acetyltransferase